LTNNNRIRVTASDVFDRGGYDCPTMIRLDALAATGADIGPVLFIGAALVLLGAIGSTVGLLLRRRGRREG
jgi:hypothetical protein